MQLAYGSIRSVKPVRRTCCPQTRALPHTAITTTSPPFSSSAEEGSEMRERIKSSRLHRVLTLQRSAPPLDAGREHRNVRNRLRKGCIQLIEHGPHGVDLLL
jgi:hypothetical protein